MNSTEETKVEDMLVTLPLGELWIPTYAWSTSTPTANDGYIKVAPVIVELPSVPVTTVCAKVHNVREEHFALLTMRASVKVIEDVIESHRGTIRVLKRILLQGAEGVHDTEYFLTP